MDYTNLNDVCPNDSFLLSRVDQIIDSTSGHGMFSFLDVLSEYHQILMFQPNKEKMSFFILQGLHCYNVMLFRLKNAGATY